MLLLTNNRNCLVKGSSLTGTVANLAPNQDFVPLSDVVGLPTQTDFIYIWWC
jgi:hypothetical protein